MIKIIPDVASERKNNRINVSTVTSDYSDEENEPLLDK